MQIVFRRSDRSSQEGDARGTRTVAAASSTSRPATAASNNPSQMVVSRGARVRLASTPAVIPPIAKAT